MPVLNRLVRQIYQSNDLSKYYDIRKSVDEFKTFKSIYKNSEIEGYQNLLRNKNMLMLERRMKAIDHRVKLFDDAIEKQVDDKTKRSAIIKQKNDYIEQQMKTIDTE
jgi:hypothetical protein